jgi:hypothetical protein
MPPWPTEVEYMRSLHAEVVTVLVYHSQRLSEPLRFIVTIAFPTYVYVSAVRLWLWVDLGVGVHFASHKVHPPRITFESVLQQMTSFPGVRQRDSDQKHSEIGRKCPRSQVK